MEENFTISPSSAKDWQQFRCELTDERVQRLEEAAIQRTDRIRLVLQDVDDPHNVAACLRSAEAFGIQNVDVIQESSKYKPSTVARGVSKWLSIRTHPSIIDAVKQLKQQGFRIAVGMPAQQSHSLEDLPVGNPLAVVFANEHEGADSSWLTLADYTFTIPISGLVESLNVSVSAAVTLYSLRQRLLRASAQDALLDAASRRNLLDDWAQMLAEQRRPK